MYAMFDVYMPGLDYTKLNKKQLAMKLAHLEYIRVQEGKVRGM
jgi:hypothetical protein